MDALETRSLLSAAVVGGVWRIDGASNVQIHYGTGENAGRLEVYLDGQLAGEADPTKIRAIRILGTSGNDTINANFAGGISVRCVVRALDGDDNITTGDANDLIFAGAGNDTVNTNGGNDWVFGADGGDVINGGDGRDFLFGGRGDDTIDGGSGNDRIVGNAGSDTLKGGSGRNFIDGGGGGNDAVNGSTIFDRVVRRRHLTINGVQAQGLIDADSYETLKQKIIDQQIERYKNLFGTTYTNYPWPIYHYGGGFVLSGSAVTAMGGSPSSLPNVDSANDYSRTNNQIAGVEESDIVKTDGDFLYVLKNIGSDKCRLTIIKTIDADNPEVVSTVEIDGYVSGLYINGDKITVVSGLGYGYPVYGTLLISIRAFDYAPPPAPKTIVTTIDVSDHENPAVVDKTTVNGQLIDSREVDGNLYLVVSNGLQLPGPRATKITNNITEEPELPLEVTNRITGISSFIAIDRIWFPGPQQTYQYETEEQYRDYLESIINDYLPYYVETVGGGPATLPMALPGSITYLDDSAPTALTSVVAFDLSDAGGGPKSSATVGVSATQVYANANSLYVFDSNSSGLFGSGNQTHIAKFDLNGDQVSFAAVGAVEGYIPGRYAMDEHNGFLRVMSGNIPNGSTFSSSLFVLKQVGTQLQLVSEINNIEPGERITSVRFIGERAYVVTYRFIDPLTVIDLSDPLDPKIAGHVEMPGFSSHLQFIDDTHMIGVGQFDQSWNGIQVNLFDVSDINNPIVLQQINAVDTTNVQWDYSRFSGDPHTVSYFMDENLLVLPVSGVKIGDAYFTGFTELKYTPGVGFEHVGLIEQAGENSSSRALMIGGRVYTVTGSSVKVTEAGNPSNMIAEVAMP
jgi:uncharacterized secreted protein with C-terminal beta-propeller domain